jgi:apolipoprotein N-acyltransferase
MTIKCYTTDSKFKIKTSENFIQELKSHPVMQTLFVLSLFITTLAYGYSVIARSSEAPAAGGSAFGGKQSQVKITVVQGNIEQKFKWDQEYQNYIMDRYEDLTIEAVKDKPQLIIWPETAVPGFLNYDKELLQWMKNIIQKIKIPLLVGAPTLDTTDTERYYNSAALFSDKKDIVAQYNKLHLVAFGEFIPFEKQFPFLRKLFPISGGFISGGKYTVFRLRTPNSQLPTNFSVLICFEDIFPNLVRQFVKNGADFMVNITNDAWFDKSAAAYQHAANSVFRAVENRRPFARSANTGLSCFIEKTGRIYEKVSKNNKDLFVEGTKTAFITVEEDKKYSFYTKFGDIFILGCIILLIISCISAFAVAEIRGR